MNAFNQQQHDEATRRRAELIADVEADLALGIERERIAAGYRIAPNSLARNLYRAGRPDLAAGFNHKTWRPGDNHRKHQQCADCGALCSDRAERCRRCANSRSAAEQWQRVAA